MKFIIESMTRGVYVEMDADGKPHFKQGARTDGVIFRTHAAASERLVQVRKHCPKAYIFQWDEKNPGNGKYFYS